MSNWKIVFASRISRPGLLALIAGCTASLLITHQSYAAPTPDTPPISSAETNSSSGPILVNQHPVIVAILKQLGVKPKTPDSLTQNSSSPALSVTPDVKLANLENSDTPQKTTPAKQKKPKAAAHVKTQKQALAAFYSRADQLPLWVSKHGILKTTLQVLAEFEHADAYGLRPKDFKISPPESGDNPLTSGQLAEFELNMSKMALQYAAYAKGGRIDPRKLSRWQDRSPNLPAPEMVLAALDDSDRPATTLQSYHPQHQQFEALRKKLLAQMTASDNAKSDTKKKKKAADKTRARLLINMERWRWMPDKMQGNNNIFVWANVPELKVRIIREGKTVFYERVIAGLRSKQSPMFSDKMEWIEFNPTWFIPNSIKVADILPSLRRKGRVMSRYHLKLNCGVHGTDFSKIDWKKVDIRKCSVIQPTGAKSVLGKLKFKFPNKHAVYMHDTLTPGLFNQKHRILSHGCIRVRDPRRMAEILLANDKGMSSKRVRSLLARGGLHTEHLKKSIPVHITYFSTRVKKDGALSHHPDYYGHDKRLAQALLGKGHLFRGAIYSGSSRSRRKRKPRKAKPKPTVYQQIFANQ